MSDPAAQPPEEGSEAPVVAFLAGATFAASIKARRTCARQSTYTIPSPESS